MTTQQNIKAAALVGLKNIRFAFDESGDERTCVLDDAYFHGFGVELRFRVEGTNHPEAVKLGRDDVLRRL